MLQVEIQCDVWSNYSIFAELAKKNEYIDIWNLNHTFARLFGKIMKSYTCNDDIIIEEKIIVLMR